VLGTYLRPGTTPDLIGSRDFVPRCETQKPVTSVYYFKFDEIKISLILKRTDMQFILIAYDGTDEGAFERRMKSRPEHLEKISHVKKAGEFLCGGAILDDAGKMTGSMILYDVPDRAALDERLKDEPYIYNKVWEKIEIRPFRLATIG
jgi:uncharacterized protein YciI